MPCSDHRSGNYAQDIPWNTPRLRLLSKPEKLFTHTAFDTAFHTVSNTLFMWIVISYTHTTLRNSIMHVWICFFPPFFVFIYAPYALLTHVRTHTCIPIVWNVYSCALYTHNVVKQHCDGGKLHCQACGIRICGMAWHSRHILYMDFIWILWFGTAFRICA